jgi:Co/Zn/Cd efflux system component
MSAGCCNHNHGTFEGVSADYKRRLWIVIALNAAMFVVEMTAGRIAGSQALQADALDFFADALTYGMSLAVIGAALRVRATAALAKGISLFGMGLWVFGSTVYAVFVLGVPQAEVMGFIGFLALLTNLASVLILVRYKDGDANVRSVWLCSRNDAIGNVAVMVAALGVWGTATGWPDVIVAGIMAGLFLSSSVQIVTRALAEWRTDQPVADGPCVDITGRRHSPTPRSRRGGCPEQLRSMEAVISGRAGRRRRCWTKPS